MSGPRDGGPAFPVPDPGWLDVNTIDEAKRAAAGMTLRDYFAAKAMQGACVRGWQSSYTLQQVAADCYRLADAMLEVRK